MRAFLLVCSSFVAVNAIDTTSFPEPPCGISRDDFYTPDMLNAQISCWDASYTPCATDCSHLKTLLNNYWNEDAKCQVIRTIADKIESTAPFETNMKFFPNRKNCGKQNGKWVKPDGTYIETEVVHESNTKTHTVSRTVLSHKNEN